MFEDSVSSIPSIWASMNSWFTPAVLFVLLNVMIGTIAFTSTLANQNKHHNQQEQSQIKPLQQQQQYKLAASPSLLQRVRSINFYSYRSQEANLLTTTATATATAIATSNNNPGSTNHFNMSPDSHTLFNFEDTQQLQKLENPSHYIFEEPHQENGAIDAQVQYNYFQQNQQENGEIPSTQFFFEQTQEGKTLETETGYQFSYEHENEEKLDQEKAIEEEEGYGDFQSLDEVYSKLTGCHVSRTKSDTEPSAGEVPTKLPTKMKKSASLKSSFGHFEEEEIVETRRPATVRERGVAKVTEVDEGVDAKADDFINKFKQQLKLQRLDSIIRYKDMITRGSGK